MVDTLIHGKTRTRREFCAYYTKSDPILYYMIARLQVTDGDLILEPCAGDGVFIEQILDLNQKKDFRIDAFDLNVHSIKKLREKFSDNRVYVKQMDTLLDLDLDWHSNAGGCYTKIIGNPPYGAWQENRKREVLKKRYGGYVRETYTLFLRRCLDLLKTNGRLTFIVPDTFLALHMHKDTRKKILQTTHIEEILLMPSRFFPGVNFGYSNLCIITFTKSKTSESNKINIVSVSDSVDSLYRIADGDYSVASHFEQINQQKVLASIDHAFLIGGSTRIRRLVNQSELILGDVADCVTGFYSGDNKKFLCARNQEVKGANDYTIIDQDLVEQSFLSIDGILNGLKNGKKYIPILKGGNGVLRKPTDWFIKWDFETVKFYKSNKASRFQNSHFYFREGIGVPMIKSGKVAAFMLEKRLFDQSIVGVFPKDETYLDYLLAFLNSHACSRILKVINHTANNSANYLKKLPVIFADKVMSDVDGILKQFNQGKTDLNDTLEKIDKVFDGLYKV